MEKLQAALDQARRNRGGGSQRDVSGLTTRRRMIDQRAADEWNKIDAVEIDPSVVLTNRLVSIHGGQEAAVFDVLRTKILQLITANSWTRIAITSPTPGCGKTTLSANLAASFGRQIDMRTILMDMDMRKPSLGTILGHRSQNSVYDVLEERVSFAEQARRLGPNVAFSMNAAPAVDPSELFLRQRTAEVIDAIERLYQPGVMLFDLPPMLANDDTSAFLRMVDCVLLVAEAEVSTVKQIDACEKELSEQSNVLGVVLNKCRFPDDVSAYRYPY